MHFPIIRLLLLSWSGVSLSLGAPGEASLRIAGTAPSASAAGSAGSYSPRFSANGRFVVFVSRADNLVPNDYNGNRLDVFVRDLQENTTRLVSVNADGTGSGNSDSWNPVISSNGQFVAFESTASDLVTNDVDIPGPPRDVYQRDMVRGVTILVSTDTLYDSTHPAMTTDGRWVVFEHTSGYSTRIASVWDMTSGTNLYFSIHVTELNSKTLAPSPSNNGQRIAYWSTASFNGLNGESTGDVYVYDQPTGTTLWASANVYSNRTGLTIRSFNPVLSADGRFVAFKSASSSTNLHFHDLQTGLTTLVSSNVPEAGFPEMSSDGRYLAFESETNVFRWDSQTGTRLLVSVDQSGTGPARGTSYRPRMTPDGSKIAFLSDADNLTPTGGNGRFQIYLRDLAAETTRLVSVNLDGKPGSDLSGTFPAISADGNLIAFESPDDRLVPDDGNGNSDVFLRDLRTDTTTLISARDPGLPSQTGVGFVALSRNCSSADGRFVVYADVDGGIFESKDQRLQHIYVRDLATGTRVSADLPRVILNPPTVTARDPVLSANGRHVAYFGRVTDVNPPSDYLYVRDLDLPIPGGISRALDGQMRPVGTTGPPSISGDGRLVAFHSDAGDLVANDANGVSDVFVRDVDHHTNILVSVSRDGTESGNGESVNPILSRDGRWIVFQSSASNLGEYGYTAYFELFARDLVSNVTFHVSYDADAFSPEGDPETPVLSLGNHLLLFTNSYNEAFLYDLLSQSEQLVCDNCFQPAVSPDGRWLAYETILGTNAIKDIVLEDLQSGETNLVSVNRDASGGGSASSTSPLLTYDGRYVVFASRATNLVDNDNNLVTDIFVRDRLLNTTFLGSLNRYGTGPGNSVSCKPVLGADGRTVYFQSFANDLVDRDDNNSRDIFALRLGSDDSDGDGLDDDWELAYFDTLDRDGSGDYDGDGHTDRQEFLAGTDPTNTGSIFKILTVTSLHGTTTVLWSATPGKTYRIQFKNSLEDAEWTDLPGPVTATGSMASLIDDSAGAATHRYYRAILVP
jgi:Tol biopolymer transport system component